MVALVFAMVLLWCCYGVGVARCCCGVAMCCYGVARWLLGGAMVLLGCCYGFARLLGGC